ncbi:cytochrome c oxidase assembly protein COX15 homolog isoform X2 [Drosophila miranda]|nr:cytochrome c oxidase assembly protein COX15 homolog isoform X2 [Drosophila miranda]
MWGRAIGGFFLVPAAYFWKKGYFCPKTKNSVLLLGTLIGLPGLMGWYMVKSGLENRFEDQNDVPRVSQYRLASHLAAAFVLYALSLSQAMSKLFPSEPFVVKAKKAFNIKGLSHMTKGMVFLTAISGAFVAGLDAGLVYNSLPKMGDSWIPDDMWQFKPIQRNITQNPTTVQFNHRIVGITTVSLATALWQANKLGNQRCVRHGVDTSYPGRYDTIELRASTFSDGSSVWLAGPSALRFSYHTRSGS